jgi:hypothetical protein
VLDWIWVLIAGMGRLRAVGSDFGLIVGCSRAMVDLVRWLGEDREVVKEGIR